MAPSCECWFINWLLRFSSHHLRTAMSYESKKTQNQQRSYLPYSHCSKHLPTGYRNAILTHWGWDKMSAILQKIFSSAFSWMKLFEFRLKFTWNLLLGVLFTLFQHWLRGWLGAVQATSHCLNQWWLDYQCIYESLGFHELKWFEMMWTYFFKTAKKQYFQVNL